MMVIMVLVKHMIRNILDYLRWSDLVITFILNPCNWKINFKYLPPNDLGPKMHLVNIKLLMFKLEIVIDDGSW